MLRRREQLLSVMATEVCQATEEVLTIVNTSWEPADCHGMRERLASFVPSRLQPGRPRSSLAAVPSVNNRRSPVPSTAMTRSPSTSGVGPAPGISLSPSAAASCR